MGDAKDKSVAAHMKSTAPWSVKGIERDARETAKDAARREGMTLGEWLNKVIYIAGDGETGLSALSSDAANDSPRLGELKQLMVRLSEHVSGAEQNNSAQIDELTRKVGSVLERVQRVEQGGNRNQRIEQALIRLAEADQARARSVKALETAVTHIATQFNRAQKQAGERFTAVDGRFNDMFARLDGVAPALLSEDAAEVGRTVADLSERLARAEAMFERSGAPAGEASAEFVESVESRFRILGDEIKRTGDRTRGVEKSISDLSTKIEDAEKRSAVAVERLAETINVLREDLLGRGADRNGLESHLTALARTTEERIGALQASFKELADRLQAGDFERAADLAASTSREAVLVADDEDEFGDDELAEDGLSDELDEFADPFADDNAEDQFGASAANAGHQDGGSRDETADAAAPTGRGDRGSSGMAALIERARSTTNQTTSPVSKTAGAPASETAEDDGDDDIDDIMAELDALGFGAGDRDDDEAEAEDDLTAFGGVMASDDEEIGGNSRFDADLDDDDEGEGGGDPLDELADDEAAYENRADVASPDESAADDDGDDGMFDRELAAARSTAAVRSDEETTADGPGAIETAVAKAKSKRRLTPRQRAILQAKIRRKRLAEARARRGLDANGDDSGGADVAAAFSPDNQSGYGQSESDAAAIRRTTRAAHGDASKPSVFERIKGALGLAGDAKADSDEAHSVDEPTRSRSGLASKPVTAALGIGVVLTGAAFAFLLRDGAIAPQRNASLILPGPASNDAARAAAPAAQAAERAQNASFEAPAAMEPRELFAKGIEEYAAATGDRDRKEAIAMIRKAAALGHPPAQLQLGEMLKIGQDVDRNFDEARAWYRRAANGGHVLAMHRLGVMAARGEGGPVDVAESIDWFEKASNYGLVNSMYNLGATYHPTGEEDASGIQDAAKAYYWYMLAAKNGDDQAANLADGVADLVPAEERSDIDARVAAWTAAPRDPAANERFGA